MSDPTPLPSPAPSRPVFDFAAWLPKRRAWLWVLLAFVAGLILFGLLISRSKPEDDFYRADKVSATATTPVYAPLPAPLPADGEDTAGAPAPQTAADEGDEEPRLVETAPPPPPSSSRPAAPAPLPQAAPVATRHAEPISARAPHYPPAALRRGDRGTVKVRVEVAANGVPNKVGVEQGSGSRLLDRAAVDAVRDWRFRPAMANGQPVADTVVVPIDFNPNR